MKNYTLCGIDAVEKMIQDLGFLPFFENRIPGFSIAEHTPEELWFSREQDGPWEWKGPILVKGECAYGKFFAGKCGFVSLEWLPHFINYRRSLSSKITEKEKKIVDAVCREESMLTTDLKQLCGEGLPKCSPRNGLQVAEAVAEKAAGIKPGIKKGKEITESLNLALTRLQMSTRLCIADFEYKQDKKGKPYGWGIARYTTPELLYGNPISSTGISPEASLEKIRKHLDLLFPQQAENIQRLLIGK